MSKISFMVFRTGSVLIVGKCSENTIMQVYNFIKDMLREHYLDIVEVQNDELDDVPDKGEKKKKKLRRFARVAVMSA